MIIVQLIAKIKPAWGQIVVIKTVGKATFEPSDREGHMLIERIGFTRVIAPGVKIAHLEATARPFQFT